MSAVRRHRFASGGLSHVEARLHGGVPAFSQLSDSQPRHRRRCDLVTLLTRYQFVSKLMLILFAPIQQQIVAEVAAPYRVVLYRRCMVRIAEALARLVDAKPW